MDSAEAGGGQERLTELEQRLERLESRPGARERGRGILAQVIPPDARRHLRTGARENLLAMRSIVDAWIGFLDRSGPDTGTGDTPPGRETIRID